MMNSNGQRHISLSRGERVASEASRVRAYSLSCDGNPLTPTLSPMGRGRTVPGAN
jgi:hypothetical protein